jgi:4-hydroxy-tetrahydrodipicolinate synthase
MNLLPRGTWPVMLTPFNDDSSIDWSGLKSLIDFYLSKKVNGLFACCGSSEVNHLLPTEIISISKEVVRYVKGAVPVVAGAICRGNIQEQAEFVRKIFDTGVSAAIITASQIADENTDNKTWDSLVQEMLRLTGNIPLGMYEYPNPYHRLLSPEQMKWIAESGRFIFHKDTCCDIEKIAKKLIVIKNTKMRFYNAHIETFIDSLRLGADGFSGVALNFYPELITWIYSHYDSQDNNTLGKINEFVIKSEKLFCTNYFWAAKYFLSLRGVNIKTFCRAKMNINSVRDSITLKNLLNDTYEIMKTMSIC